MTYFAINPQKLTPSKLGRLIPLLVAMLLITLACLSPTGITAEKNISLSWLFLLRGPLKAPENTIIVSLNSAAAERMGLSRHSDTWSRKIYADLIHKLADANARLTVLDIALKAPRDEEQDSQLEAALKYNPRVLLYTYFKRYQIPLIQGSADIEHPIPPIPRFNQYALGSGHFSLTKSDSIITEVVLFKELSEHSQQSQPLLALLANTPIKAQREFWQAFNPTPFNADTPLVERAFQFRQSLITPSKTLQKAEKISNKQLFDIFSIDKPLIINYYGPAKTFKTIDIDAALAMTLNEFKQYFRNKTVYIGYMDMHQTEQQDAYRTVYTDKQGVDISGVEISATVFENLSKNTFIRTTTPLTLWLLTITAFSLGLLLFYLPHYFNISVQTFICSSYIFGAYYTFDHYVLALPLIMPITGLALSNAVQLHHSFTLNKLRLRHIRFALEQYLPTEAANKISENINSLEKQHALVFGVVLMTDIKGYTTLSENLPPAQLHSLMNRYYQQLINIVKANNGVIGNIVGDSLTAIWTGSALTKDMGLQAMQASTDIHKMVYSDAEFSECLPTCTALHGGKFSLGNLGGAGHYEYSPVGDIINTVSRIEHFNRDLDTQFLCSAAVYEQVKNTPEAKNLYLLGEFTLRNKKEKLTLYTALNPQDENRKITVLFTEAIQHFDNNDFNKALPIFKQLLNSQLQGPTKYYINACLIEMDKNISRATTRLTPEKLINDKTHEPC